MPQHIQVRDTCTHSNPLPEVSMSSAAKPVLVTAWQGGMELAVTGGPSARAAAGTDFEAIPGDSKRL